MAQRKCIILSILFTLLLIGLIIGLICFFVLRRSHDQSHPEWNSTISTTETVCTTKASVTLQSVTPSLTTVHTTKAYVTPHRTTVHLNKTTVENVTLINSSTMKPVTRLIPTTVPLNESSHPTENHSTVTAPSIQFLN